jgi:hypothetical protein
LNPTLIIKGANAHSILLKNKRALLGVLKMVILLDNKVIAGSSITLTIVIESSSDIIYL